MKLEGVLTYRQLKEFVNQIPEEFLDDSAGVSGDETFAAINSAGFTNQNFYAPEGEWDEMIDEKGYESLSDQDKEGYEIVIKKGEPFLSEDQATLSIFGGDLAVMNTTPDDGESSAPGEDEGGEGGTDPRHVHPSQPPVGGN